MKMELLIKSKKEYHQMMVTIYTLMNKGEKKLTKLELTKLSQLTKAAALYEEKNMSLTPIKEPETLSEIIELKLFQHKMTQAKLADQIGLAKSKVSEILNGKRKADIPFLKGVHKVLNIDASLLLEKTE
jgi:HTH-type transcriptional regulator / antitoxin HigA